MSNLNINDIDPIETQEWLDSLNSVIEVEGKDRAQFIVKTVIDHAAQKNLEVPTGLNTAYVNTIPADKEVAYPGDIELEKRIQAAIRWNAIMMVQKGEKTGNALGGHLSTYQSCSDMWEVCFNHILHAATDKDGGDLLYIQGHAAPGAYSRAYVEGRLSEEKISNFRQETHGKGVSSYPHPHLLPDFWQFPTVSMGLGAITAVHQARYLKYLNSRGLKDTTNQSVIAFIGDGEMDETESKGALALAGREKVNNLIFIVNCNLQRLDGPVWANGKIINELERIYKGSGWKVIKLIWGSMWDELFAKDTSGKLVQALTEIPDGSWQDLESKDATYVRENFFNKSPELAELIKDYDDAKLEALMTNLGGHDFKKFYNAIIEAKNYQDGPVVILAQTVKGIGLGKAAQGLNIAHQVKKLNHDSVCYVRDHYAAPFTDEECDSYPFWKFAEDSKEFQYLTARRESLGGYLPKRRQKFDVELKIPTLKDLGIENMLEAQNRPIATTMGFVRFLTALLDHDGIKERIVPIVADESRTFGMEGLFRKIGIYNPFGQQYIPQDRKSVAYYREDTQGQLFQEGINEQGAISTWIAAATSYSTNNCPTIPFFIYYSMFGFQRCADLLWGACDQQARGFLLGATSGRTTLNGEGLQHQDGHSHVISAVMPGVVSYDPAYVYELAIIMQNGLERMYGPKQENVYYYITVLNEVYEQPAMPEGSEEGILKGIYKLKQVDPEAGESELKVQLLGSGSILRHVNLAADILAKHGISSVVYSVTSFTELARDGQRCERLHRLNPFEEHPLPYVTEVLEALPTVAATDYVRAYSEQIRPFLPTVNYNTLGTDGYGRSDSRANLRDFFEVDAKYIALTAVYSLLRQRTIEPEKAKAIISELGIEQDRPYSLDR